MDEGSRVGGSETNDSQGEESNVGRGAVESRDESVGRARDAALHLLSFRARSVAEMERRLRKKAFDDSVVAEVVAWLVDLGYLDDREFARQFLDERLRRRPRGPFALVRELQKRGVDQGMAEEVLDALMAEKRIDETDLARDTARRWLSRQSRGVVTLLASGGSTDSARGAGSAGSGESSREDFLKVRKRLYGHLERKGFSRGVIREVVEALLDELEEG